MKCHKPVFLWKGIDSQDDLEKILPPPWKVHNFVGFDQAKKMGGSVKAHALCAVPPEVNTPCEDLLRCLDEAIWQAKCPDDGEAGHVGETARTYGSGSNKKRGS